MDIALISLLKMKPFEYITVSELCKKADVNRSTFYLHYENMCDLLDEATRYLLDDFLSYFSNDTKIIAFNISECELDDLNFVCDKYLNPYFTYLKENREVFLTALSNIKSFKFDDVYKKLYENIFAPILSRFHYPEEDRKYVMLYYLNGINAINIEWLKDGCKKTIQEMTKIVTECIFGLPGKK